MSLTVRSGLICRSALIDSRCRSAQVHSPARKRKHGSISGYTLGKLACAWTSVAPVHVQRQSSRCRSQHRLKHRTVSAAATHAEAIAFTESMAVECEEEDFYSILGVVRSLLPAVSMLRSQWI